MHNKITEPTGSDSSGRPVRQESNEILRLNLDVAALKASLTVQTKLVAEQSKELTKIREQNKHLENEHDVQTAEIAGLQDKLKNILRQLDDQTLQNLSFNMIKLNSKPEPVTEPDHVTFVKSEDVEFDISSLENLDLGPSVAVEERSYLVHGDAQSFTELLKEEIVKEAAEKEAALERKRKREKEVTHSETSEEAGLSKKKKANTENQDPEKPISKRTPKALETPSVRPQNSKSKHLEDMDTGAPSVPKIMFGGSKLTIRIPPLKSRYIPKVCVTTQGLEAMQFSCTLPATCTKHRMPSLSSHSDYPLSDTTEIGYDDLSELSDSDYLLSS
ncbi:hypothetical protein BDR04DRAFT_1234033 [Suillus decipiens]|nr:hypothetical protein BDR04DRAFT_1234033 [Suillus decipiens]